MSIATWFGLAGISAGGPRFGRFDSGIPTKGWPSLFKNRVGRSKYHRPQTNGVYVHSSLPGTIIKMSDRTYLVGPRGERRRVETA